MTLWAKNRREHVQQIYEDCCALLLVFPSSISIACAHAMPVALGLEADILAQRASDFRMTNLRTVPPDDPFGDQDTDNASYANDRNIFKAEPRRLTISESNEPSSMQQVAE
jgi:hypothetical protein